MSSKLSSCTLQDLHEQIALQGGVLKAEQVLALCNQFSLSFSELKEQLLPICEMFAVAPISQFKAAAIAQGEYVTDGVLEGEEAVANLYFGANLEFEYQALSLVVHAEQTAINNAWHHGEPKITGMTINAAPCGYCRQFMNEVRGAREMPMQVSGRNTDLDTLLPEPFNPASLGVNEMLFDDLRQTIEFEQKVDRVLQDAMETSYAPYTKNNSACLIETVDNQRFVGRYAENCAYSPSLSPLQSALSQMMMHGLNPYKHPIKRITLAEVEGKANQLGVSQCVLQSLSSDIEFTHVLGRVV
ncbi:cytidine deaminase [Psychrosphaera ytuae]|uniref:Cytidine deaminase n=1 Tax=Psychrosphaera ytuae TaxID=2820710 RepID=A0A975D9Y5_9GAMM|nr:cytidine deaminase [Psychrosphaera ytuae]QTH63320.1 cytidine deaminase [Psychrosphaera ytuae]